MANIKIVPSKISGEVRVPPSKSIAHRAVICAALCDGISKVYNIDYSDDIIATIVAMRSLGAKITGYDDYIEVIGIYNEKCTINPVRVIDCKESGSTLRFMIPITLVFEGMSKFIGEGNLGKRPLDTYINIFEEQGISYSEKTETLSMFTKGRLKPGEFKVEGNVSSQFITGLIFALPLLNGDSKIIITTEMESKGYIDLTLACIRDFGVEIINNNYKEFIIKGNQRYKARDYRIEGDFSQAAFYLSADALGSEVQVNDLNLESLQGDKAVIDILKRMGVTFEDKGAGVLGIASENLTSTIIDASQCPDIIPVLSLVAALSKGTTEIVNAGRLRIKECDRLAAVTSELSKLGANIIEKENGLIIEGKEMLNGGVEVWSWKDHRIAMMLAIASTRCKEPIIIRDYECIAKSYPNFFEDFKSLGGEIYEWDLGK